MRALAPPAADTRPVLVAAHDLSAGHVLEEADLRQVDWPADADPPPARSSGAGDLTGRALASPILAGEPVTATRLVGPGLLTGQPAGTLAVPVRLADAPATGVVSVGDRVDLIAGTPAGLDVGPAPPSSGAEFESRVPQTDVVAFDVLVLAVPGAPPGDASGGGGLGGLTGGDETDTAAAGLLVVAADRATAVRLAGAQSGRVLSLAVRAAKEVTTMPP
jgi:Flp pilus assembly protein CpaB